jgi:FtsP/CotA-like multicopper oxidase with cupredoxin domain
MGMDMSNMSMGKMGEGKCGGMSGMSKMGEGKCGGMKGMKQSDMGSGMQVMDHRKMAANPKYGSGKAGFGSNRSVVHTKTEFGPHIDMRADAPQYKIDDPGIGLRNSNRRVLVYSDLKNLYPTPDPREPEREIDLHLTGNMSRYMWSMNGIKFADADPLRFKFGERLRINFINDTMMNHPMHLHGMWSDLETGDPERIPRKHTVIVQPGSRVSYLVTADAMGSWAYHCHLVFHMLGMFRKVVVS